MKLNFWKYYKKKFLKYKKQGIDISLQIEVFFWIRQNNQSSLSISVWLRMRFLKKWRELQKTPLIKGFLYIFRAGWVAF